MSKQISQRAVEETAERLKRNSNMTSEQARKIAIDSANRVNQQNQKKGK